MESVGPPGIGVIFDMDGVLVDSAQAHRESWKVLAEEIGIPFAKEDFDRTFGRQNRDIIPIALGIHEPDRVAELGDRKEAIYRDLVRAEPPIVAGAIQLVRELHGMGVKLAVGSSAPSENVKLIVDAMGLDHCFHALVTGDEVEKGKPDPEVFLRCARKLSCDPARCVVVEDAPAGVDAAVHAGAKVVAVLIHHTADAFADADRCVDRLSSLTAAELIELAGS